MSYFSNAFETQYQQNKKGRLEIFFGYAKGSGKTYAMLDDAQEQMKRGVNVLIGCVEQNAQPETMELMHDFKSLPLKILEHQSSLLKEFDLDAALELKPELILVDDLAHTNAPGVRNNKRYQDIEELLNAGIDVYTTVNVLHLESLKDIVESITKEKVKETIPDHVFNNADKIQLIDIEPEELLKRFNKQKMDGSTLTDDPINTFLTEENLRLLREIAMRKVANRISYANQKESRLSRKMANIKLMVCISSSPSSAKCIRWTQRTAEAFHAPWTAVYVENLGVDYVPDIEKQCIRDNLDLAERMGAEIVNLSGYDVPTVIARYAKLTGITNIIIGKSRTKKSLRNLFKPSLEDQLISQLPSIEIHIIPGELPSIGAKKKKYKRFSFGENMRFSFQDALKTIITLGGATLFSMVLHTLGFENQYINMIYILSVLIISRVTSGYIYGISAAILSVLLFNFFFSFPYFSLHTIERGSPIAFSLMLLVALTTSTLTLRIKKQSQFSVEREHRTEVLYEINKKLLVSRDLQNTVGLLNHYLVDIFKRSAIFYTQDPINGKPENFLQSLDDPDASFLLSEDEKAIAHWTFINKKCAGKGTDTFTSAGAFYMPIFSEKRVFGVIGLSCANGKLDQNNRLFLSMIASQAEMALERHYLSAEQSRMLIESEKEKLRSNLLRAISHDLRTPLTGILGSSSALLENRKNFDDETLDTLIVNIKEESQWLIRMVENLLSVTRISEGPMTVTKSPEAVEEIVAESISRIRKRFATQKILVSVPEELLVVEMDGTLIEQVLINLLENAIKHSSADSTIRVEVKKTAENAVFEVIDNGSGLSDQHLSHIFESYIPDGKQSADSSRGMGIGLSICKSIINAHQGKMEAANKNYGGAVFRFTLPLEE